MTPWWPCSTCGELLDPEVTPFLHECNAPEPRTAGDFDGAAEALMKDATRGPRPKGVIETALWRLHLLRRRFGL